MYILIIPWASGCKLLLLFSNIHSCTPYIYCRAFLKFKLYNRFELQLDDTGLKLLGIICRFCYSIVCQCEILSCLCLAWWGHVPAMVITWVRGMFRYVLLDRILHPYDGKHCKCFWRSWKTGVLGEWLRSGALILYGTVLV